MKSIFLIFISVLLTSCTFINEKDTIKIGVVLGLTGTYSHIGSYEKRGIILAFDKIDYQINGKKIELIFKDDKQDKASNIQAINDLIEDDVKIIIANATSSMSKISYDILSKHKDILQFSPSASSSYFTGKKDNFFRVQPTNSREQLEDIINLLKKYNAKSIYLIGDKRNKAYLDDYIKLLDNHETLKYEKILDSNSPYKEILENVKNADFIVQVQNSVDAANLTQYLGINNINVPKVISGSAMNKEFLENAGKWANGIYFTSSSYINRTDAEYKSFAKEFYELYNHQPNKRNMQGYQVAQILIEAFSSDNYTIDEIKNYILKKEIFPLLGDELSFNKYGDIKNSFHLFQVIDNKIEKID